LRHLKAAYCPSKNPYVKTINNPVFCYRCFDGTFEEVLSVNQKVTVQLSDELLQEPGLVNFCGRVYDLRRDGVYRFYLLGKISEQRMVCDDGISSYLKMCGYLWAYGANDNQVIESDLYKKLKSQIVSCACGPLTSLNIFLARKLHFTARRAGCVTLDDWGGQDDGHTLLELLIESRWVAYDPSFNMMFSYEKDYLSVYQISRLGFPAVSLEGLPGNPFPREYKYLGYNYDFWVMARFLSQEFLLAWYQKIFQVPLLFDKGRYHFPLNTLGGHGPERYQWQYLGIPDAAFLEKFYGADAHVE
jgi:hypothetical protein